jgi:hypothetical protein
LSRRVLLRIAGLAHSKVGAAQVEMVCFVPRYTGGLGPKWTDCAALEMHTHAGTLPGSKDVARWQRWQGTPVSGIRCQPPPRLPNRRLACQRGKCRFVAARCGVLPSSAACCRTVLIWVIRTSASVVHLFTRSSAAYAEIPSAIYAHQIGMRMDQAAHGVGAAAAMQRNRYACPA